MAKEFNECGLEKCISIDDIGNYLIVHLTLETTLHQHSKNNKKKCHIYKFCLNRRTKLVNSNVQVRIYRDYIETL